MDAYRIAIPSGSAGNQRSEAVPLHATPTPPAQSLFELQWAVELLPMGLAEQDQRQFGGDLGIGAGMVAFVYLQAETRHPVVQASLAQHGVGVEHRCQFGDIEKGMLQPIAQAFFQRRASMR